MTYELTKLNNLVAYSITVKRRFLFFWAVCLVNGFGEVKPLDTYTAKEDAEVAAQSLADDLGMEVL